MLAQFIEMNQTGLLHQLHIDVHPARIFHRRGGIEIFALLVKLRRVGVGMAHHLRQPCDTRLRATGVIEQHAVSNAHAIAHEVAGLIIAHTIPRHGLLRFGRQVVNRHIGGFGFH